MRSLVLPVLALGFLVGLAGCAGDDTNVGTPDAAAATDASHTDGSSGGDSGGGTDAGGGDSSPTDSGVSDGDAGPSTVNGCAANDFVDQTDGGTPTITFPTGALPAQYSPPCVKIKAGQSVMWSGAFASHPLSPTAGVSSANNPITATSTGTSATFAFPNAGTFGFNCELHPTVMLGAILVVP